MYQDFAEIYDRLMDDVDYRAWADYYKRLLAANGVHEGKVCECACGTGSLTIPLYKSGFFVTGVDISREMLWQAAQKSRAQGITIPFVQQNMKALNLHKPMDAVLATCDGLNYLLTEEELRSFFRAAYRSIRAGGVLAFDISTPYKLHNVLCASMICEDRDDITYMWQTRWHDQTSTVSMDLCFFVKESDGRYHRIDEHQKQRAWAKEQICDMLLETGFSSISVYSNTSFEKPKTNDMRWHFAAIRTSEQ